MTDSQDVRESETMDESGWTGPTISRRAALGVVGGIFGIGLIADSAMSQQTTETIASGGSNVAITSATQVAGTQLFIGPDTTKSNVSQQEGRVFQAVDTQVRYYSDGSQWVKLGLGSDQEAVPNVDADDVDAKATFNLPKFSSAQSGLDVGDVIYRTDLD
jgi:hypothetical protein